MILIHHNPKCGTSRNVLAAIRASGVEPGVIDYLKEGWTRGQLLGLFAAAGLTPRQALRAKQAEAAGLEGRPEAANLVAIYAVLAGEPVDAVLARFAGQGFAERQLLAGTDRRDLVTRLPPLLTADVWEHA